LPKNKVCQQIPKDHAFCLCLLPCSAVFSQLLFNFIQNQCNYTKFLNTYLDVIYKRKGLGLSKKMWLSAALLLTMVSTLESSWSLYIWPLWPTKYWENSLSTKQMTNRVPQNCWNYLSSTYMY